MLTSEHGLALIKEFEQLRLVAYKPTPNDVWTIGWGHTRGVQPGDQITPEEADVLLREDLADAERAINRLGLPLTQSQFDALVSLVYNVGGGAVSGNSTIGRALRRHRWYDAWRGFALWTKQSGSDLRGLARRRAREMALYVEDRI